MLSDQDLCERLAILVTPADLLMKSAHWSMSSLIQQRCGPRCQEWLPSPDAARCPQHRYLDDISTRTATDWFAQHDASGAFATWMRTRTRSEFDLHVQNRFTKPSHWRHDQKGARRWDSRPENIAQLFRRFVKYAADIDNGLAFVQRAVNVCERQGSCRFLDVGFAPGGMSQLLLEADRRIVGVGITLTPESGGNVYLDSLQRHARYTVIQDDAIALALASGLSGQEPFDLVICGITISGSQNDESGHGQLRDQLHLAQLLLALRHLRQGGAILTRMHLSIRPIEIQMHGVLVGVTTTRASYKPLTEFAMRKTFWMVFAGVMRDDRIEMFVSRLRRALNSGSNLEQSDLIGMPMLDAMQAFGVRIMEDLRPIWCTQTKVLQWIMTGRDDRLCGRCRRMGGGRCCHHCQKNVFDGVQLGIARVEQRMAQRTKDI